MKTTKFVTVMSVLSEIFSPHYKSAALLLKTDITVICQVQVCHTVQKVKVKVTLAQALRLCTGRMDHMGSRGIALPFHDHGTKRG